MAFIDLPHLNITSKDRQRLYFKKYRIKHLERLKIKDAEYYQKNKEKKKIDALDWQRSNPEKKHSIDRNRRARKKNSIGIHHISDIDNLKKLQKYKCAYCKCSLKKYSAIDHIIPLSKGGSNWPKNLQLLCKSCNSRKHAKLPHEWAKSNNLLL